ncbi:peptide MFS transporter [Legionella maioricensis]|uniref:Oligopeptide:H+ symporter n=1 Tax=Legionella maioricensis TaxID=2896528 RepID=A0A9X2IB97_9GAMM|nr:oligopeptide:H+ symporter [Legionella maioricensis]MCL9684739.1 oligopeptide:H+ symporter [Legionella maioricensis]MCL9687767.1 oligopeptide:H+ symporter [Legionella maioricensis]
MLKTTQKMPNGVTDLYFIQAFSTFSFAILYSSLPLYLTKQLETPNTSSNSIVGLFLAFNYVLQLIGGLIGGRYLSNRFLFFITIIIQSIGLIFLALCHTSLLYIGLSFFLVGCGLNTTCYNSMLTQRFNQSDSRRNSAFILSYGAMNIGFCAGYIASGFFDYSNQYQYLFYACMITNAITLFLIAKSWSHLLDNNTPLIQVKKYTDLLSKNFIGLMISLLLIPAMLLCFHSAHFSNGVVVTLSLIMFFIILTLGMKQGSKADQQKVMAYLILAVSCLVFWMIYFTGPIGVTLFIKNNADKNFFGFELATQWIKNVNPLVIVLGAPILTGLLNKLKSKGYNPSVSLQFVWAFILLALSFVLLSCGVIFSNSEGYTHLYWVIGYIILQGMAELLIGPIGYAMIGQIAPPQLQGVLMGTWMLVAGVAASLSHYFSNAMVKTESTNPLISNPDFLHVFKQLSLWALLGALFLYFISRKVRTLIDNTDSSKKESVEMVTTA